MNEIMKKTPTDLVDPQAQRIVGFLQEFGLPHANIIAEQSERQIIGKNLPDYLNTLSQDVKRDAVSLSKFVVGAGVGLFDYSLNAVWNEVVLNLRKKAVAYGLEIFFDCAAGGSKTREFYKTEEDLASLKDVTMLDTCRKLELISDVTYKKLRHILEMRNNIGISHPTNYTINAYELLGWLQTAIQEVLNDQPTEAAIQIQAFIANLKSHSQPIDNASKTSIEAKIKELPSHLCSNILRTVFGLYVSPETNNIVKKNISLIAPAVWKNCIDEPKYKLGLVLEGYNNNLYAEKYRLGIEFFQIVDGNSYRSANERSFIIDDLLEQLKDKHHGWDNFHHEAPVASALATYIRTQQDILPNNADKLIKTILSCRIGRGVAYCGGVSPRGKEYYDSILLLLGDKFAVAAMIDLTGYELSTAIHNQYCAKACKEALDTIKKGVSNPRLIECLDYLSQGVESKGPGIFDDKFKQLSTGYISFN